MTSPKPTVSIVELTKVPKRAGGYQPGMRYDKATETYVPDYSVRGWWQRDERAQRTRIYVWPEHWNVLEHLVDRYSRPTKVFRLAFPEMWERLGIAPMPAHWSQKAGCSCGCSPAFIVDEALGFDIHMTIKVEGADAFVDPAKADIAEARYAAVMADPTLAPLTGATS